MNFEVVSFREYKDRLYPLFEQHWKEVAVYDETIKLSLDIDMYELLEQANKFVTIVAKEDSIPVGYIIFILARHPHYKDNIIAQNDAVFLLPKYRVGKNAINLFKFAEDILKNLNVDIIATHVKPKVDFSRLLKFLGYDKQEVVYTKRLD
jgi:hypothetical protein